MFKVGDRVVCPDGYIYEDYRGTIRELVERRGLTFAIVDVDGGDEPIAELVTCLVGEEHFDSDEF